MAGKENDRKEEKEEGKEDVDDPDAILATDEESVEQIPLTKMRGDDKPDADENSEEHIPLIQQKADDEPDDQTDDQNIRMKQVKESFGYFRFNQN